ncbi:FecR family protein [Chitinivorax sp. B]|uniref:FecR family protein n=1 Tax=Chitinivorax sp. B TaxID=2502235 RepID=UPI001484CA1E|nr:FecR family protein [Chitinivorax sp. B]
MSGHDKPFWKQVLIVGALSLVISTSTLAAVCEAPRDNGIGGTGVQPDTRDQHPAENGIGGTGIQPDAGKPGDKPLENGIGGTGLRAGNGIGGTGRQQPTANYAGRVLFAKGGIMAWQPDGPARVLRKGDPVCEGDTLAVADLALAQLQMADNGKLMLRAKTRLVIDAFRKPSTMDGSERFAVTLLEGGMRAITGEIGHAHKENYAIATPLARIGIRGTDHEVFHIEQARIDLAAGTYNRVLSGGTVVEAAGSKLPLGPTEVGYVGPNGASPTLLKALPALLGTSAAELLSTSRKSTPGVEDTTSDDVVQALKLGSNRTVVNLDGTELVFAPPQSAYVGVNQLGGKQQYAMSASVLDAGLEYALALLDPSTNIPIAMADGDTGFNYISGDARLVKICGAMMDNVPVYWGLYANGTEGGFQIDPDTGDDQSVKVHHFAYSPGGATSMEVINSISGTFTFERLVGHSRLSDESGALGGRINGMSVDVMFGGNPGITRYQINLTDAQRREWSGAMDGFKSLADFAAGKLQLQTTCVGTGCGSGQGNGVATGMLVGQQGKGLATGFGLSTQTGQTVNGVAVLSRP